MGLFHATDIHRAEDPHGNPIAGATRHVYAAGSSTLSVLYRDPDLTVTVANPMVAGANGEFDLCYLEDGTYRAELRDARGALLAEREGISVASGLTAGIAGSFARAADLLRDRTLSYDGGGGRIAVHPGAAITTAEGGFVYRIAPPEAADHHVATPGGVKLHVVPGAGGFDVRAFGAAGDGIADDTAAIQAAIDAGSVGRVVLPRGTYRVVPPPGGAGALTVPEYSQVSLHGESGTYIAGDTAHGPLLNYCAGRAGGWREASAGIADITFDGLWTSDPAQVNDHGFDFSRAEGCLVAWRNDNLSIDGCSFVNAPLGLMFESTARQVAGRGGHVFGARVRGIRCRNLLYGVYFNAHDPANPTTYVGQVEIAGGWMDTIYKAAFAATAQVTQCRAQGITFDNVAFLHAFGGSICDFHFGQGQYELGFKDAELAALGLPEVLDFGDVLRGWDIGAEPERVSNGSFANADGWSASDPALSVGGGRAAFAAAPEGTVLSGGVTLEPGRTYEVQAVVTGHQQGTAHLRLEASSTSDAGDLVFDGPPISGDGLYTARIRAAAHGRTLQVRAGAGGFTADIESLSLKLVRYVVPHWDAGRAQQKQLFWGYADSQSGDIRTIRYERLRTAMLLDRGVLAIASVRDEPNIPDESVVDRMHLGDGSALRMTDYSGDKGGVGPSVFSQIVPDAVGFKKAALLRSRHCNAIAFGKPNLAKSPSGLLKPFPMNGAALTDIVADGPLFPHSSEAALPPGGAVRLNYRTGHVPTTRAGEYILITAALRVMSTDDGAAARLVLDYANRTNRAGAVAADGEWRSFDMILPARPGAAPYMDIRNAGGSTAILRIGDVQYCEFASYAELLEFRAHRQWAGKIDDGSVSDGLVKLRPTLEGAIATTRYTWDGSIAAKQFYGGSDRDPGPYYRIERMECRLVSGTGVALRGENPGGGVLYWFASVTPGAGWADVPLTHDIPPNETLADRGITFRPAGAATMQVEFRTRLRYLLL